MAEDWISNGMKPKESPPSSPVNPSVSNAPMQAGSPNDSNLINLEIEHRIPVKQPAQSDNVSGVSQQHNPIATKKQFVEEADKGDPELDHLLKDVNQKVKESDEKDQSKSKLAIGKKISSKLPGPQNSKNIIGPIFTTISAIVIASALIAVAFYAFKQNDGQVSKTHIATETSKTTHENNNTKVNPGDLSDLSLSLQSGLNELNDTEDFKEEDLSDQNLGL